MEDQVGGNPEQPGSRVVRLEPVVLPARERARERLGRDLACLIVPDPPLGEPEHRCEVPIENLGEAVGLPERSGDHLGVGAWLGHLPLFAGRLGKFHRAGIVPDGSSRVR